MKFIITFTLILVSIQYGFSQCPKAQEYMDKVKDANENWTANERAHNSCPQAWAQLGTWHIYKCDLDKGVLSQEQGENKIAKCNAQRSHIMQIVTGSNCGKIPPLLTSKDYRIIDTSMTESGNNNSGNNDKFSIYEDKILSDKTTSFIKNLAANSNNPDLKQYAKDLELIDETNQKMDNYNSRFNLNQSQSDREFQKIMSNGMQAIATAKFIVNLFKENEVELTPSQKQARSAMLKVWNDVRVIYSETNAIPYLGFYNREDLKKLIDLENSYLDYDITTARDRYLLIRFFWSNKRYDLDELRSIYDEIEGMKTIDILRKIDSWQMTANIGNAMHLPNSDIAFSQNKNVLTIKKARCYSNMGDEKKARELLEMVNLKISKFEAIKLMDEAFQAREYDLAMTFYPIAKSYFEHEESPKTQYLFDTDRSNNYEQNPIFRKVGNDFFITRNNLIKTLSCGVYSNIVSENYSNAAQELRFLEDYITKRPENDVYTQIDVNESQVILLSMQASYYLLIDEVDSAKTAIDKAIELEKTLLAETYEPWVLFVKFRQLALSKKYDEAHELYRKINKHPLMIASNSRYRAYIDVEELKFQKCLMLFEQNEFDRVLRGLELLELTNPKLKYKLLRSKVYNAIGQEAKAIEVLNK